MTAHEHHEALIKGLSEQLKEILKASDQAIYIYLDDVHKVCNQKFAHLLGYESPAQWAAVADPFPRAFVATGSQDILIRGFQKAMQNNTGSTIPITWKKKGGQTINTTVMLVPIAFQNHLFALHFVETGGDT